MNMPKWPEWETVREIGRGSFGGVYEIQKKVFTHTDKAALKVITIPQNDSDIEELYSDGYDAKSITDRYKNYLEDIVKEYNLMAELKGNHNIVYCDDLRYIQHDDGIGWDIYIKMELLTALTKVYKTPVDEQQVVKLGIDICNALIACKNKNIIHRDIKPQNIFVSQSGDFKLGDFGIAKTAERITTGTKTGTYKYMAPEVYNNQPYGTSSDLYSLGMVMYWMLNERRTPFLPVPPAVPTATEDNNARLRRMSGEKIPAPINGSEALKQIVLRACAFQPDDRFASPAEMKAELLKLADAFWNFNKTEQKSDFDDDDEGTVLLFTERHEATEEEGTILLPEDSDDSENSGDCGFMAEPEKSFDMPEEEGTEVAVEEPSEHNTDAFHQTTDTSSNYENSFAYDINPNSELGKIYHYVVEMVKMRNSIDLNRDSNVKNIVLDELLKCLPNFDNGEIVFFRYAVYSKIFGQLQISVDLSWHNAEFYSNVPAERLSENAALKREVIEMHNQMVNQCYASNDKLEAAKHCIDILSYDPNNVDTLLTLGKIYREMNCAYRAMECYNRGLELEPNNGKAYCNMAVAYSSMNDNIKARECCGKALALLNVNSYDYAVTLANYALAEGRLGNKWRAMELLQEAKMRGYQNYDKVKQMLDW